MTDAKLIRLVTEFRDGILDGGSPIRMCYAVCAPLKAYLSYFHKIESELVEGWISKGKREANHYWLRLRDGRVLDPTADQFNDVFKAKMPPVYLGIATRLHRKGEVKHG